MPLLAATEELRRAEVCNVEAWILDYQCHHHQYRKQQAAFRKKWGIKYQDALHVSSLDELNAKITT